MGLLSHLLLLLKDKSVKQQACSSAGEKYDDKLFIKLYTRYIFQFNSTAEHDNDNTWAVILPV